VGALVGACSDTPSSPSDDALDPQAAAQFDMLDLSPVAASAELGEPMVLMVAPTSLWGASVNSAVTWSVQSIDGASSGTLSEASDTGSVLVANAPGTYLLKASSAGMEGYSLVEFGSSSALEAAAVVRTIVSITTTPSTVKLAPNATVLIKAAYKWNITAGPPTLVWTATGGTVKSTWAPANGWVTPAGFYTAPATAGTYKVVARYSAISDTTVVTVTGTPVTPPKPTVPAPAPTLNSVVLTPATASVARGAKQQFTAAGKMSDNSTSSVSVTWSATGGTITTGGLYTAGGTAGSYRVIAVQQGGTKADTSVVTVTAAPPPPPPSGGTPDPTLLPVATGQGAVSAAAYTALAYYSASGTPLGTNPRNMPVGSYYVDPTTGVRVVRLTSPTAPFTAGSGSWMNGVDYAEGGLRIGRPTGSRYVIPVAPVGSGGGQDYRLITFDLSSYAVAVRAVAPGGSDEITRAMSYVTPNVMYSISGGYLRKWNVAGATAVEIVSAPFPKDLRGALHGQSSFQWLSMSDDDRWFCMMAGFSGPWLVGFDAQTNTVTEKQVNGIDEPKMDKDGRYVWARGSTPYVWDMQANTLTSVSGARPAYDGHGGTARGYAFGNPNDGRAAWSINLRSASPTYQYLGAAFNLDNVYHQGGWVDQAAGATTAQWVVVGYQTGGSGEPSPIKYRYGALGLYKLDGSDHRLLANAQNSGNINGTPDYYANTLWPNFSPDGKFLLFKSNQLVADGFSSLFAAILPAR
jgi:hypothetical protein